MKQRYTISKEGLANDLVIREYAVTGKAPSQTFGSVPLQDEYAFLYQEQYKGKDIEPSISRGTNDLIATLRTDNLFPIGLLANKIAESVMGLYRSSEDGSTELLFDDLELFECN
jgi:hypothetical protein